MKKKVIDAIEYGIVYAALGTMLFGTVFAISASAKAYTAEKAEQKYIVRYAREICTNEAGETTYVSEDGNVWVATDVPHFQSGEARLLFDSKGTFIAEDDELIDITERR